MFGRLKMFLPKRKKTPPPPVVSPKDANLVDTFSRFVLNWELNRPHIVLLLGHSGEAEDGSRQSPIGSLFCKSRPPTDDERSRMQVLISVERQVALHLVQARSNPLKRGMTSRKWFETHDLGDGKTPWGLIVQGGEENLKQVRAAADQYVKIC